MKTGNNPSSINDQFRFRGHPQKKNGGTPGSARHEVLNMEAVAEIMPRVKMPRVIGSDVSPGRKAGLWLDEQVEKSRKTGVITTITEISPALARTLLNRNEQNRKVSSAVVNSYARDMKRGAWKFNGEPIIVSADGKLNDGQHRCEAIIRADCDIQMLLVVGVERDTRMTLDQGKVRTVGDYLAMEGYSNTSQIGVIASMAWQYHTLGRMATGSNERPTKSEVLQFFEDHPNIIQSHSICSRKGVQAVGGICTVALAHWIFAQKAGKHAADDFVIALIEGANLKPGSPILYVRNRLAIDGRRLRAPEKMELLVKAWNSHRAKQDVRAYSILGGKLPKIAG